MKKTIIRGNAANAFGVAAYIAPVVSFLSTTFHTGQRAKMPLDRK